MTPDEAAIRERDAAYDSPLAPDLTHPMTGRQQMAADRRTLIRLLDEARGDADAPVGGRKIGQCGCTIHEDRDEPCGYVGTMADYQDPLSQVCDTCMRVCWGATSSADAGAGGLAREDELAEALYWTMSEPPQDPFTGDGEQRVWLRHAKTVRAYLASQASDEQGLDAAWQAAEAALPEGWAITELRRWREPRRSRPGDHDYGLPSPNWIALAGVPFTRMMGERGYGSTPAGALTSLAAALTARLQAADEGGEG